MVNVPPIHEIKSDSLNKAAAEAVNRFGPDATVLNTFRDGDDYVISVCAVDTTGIDQDALREAVQKPIKRIQESSEEDEMMESVEQIMRFVSSQTPIPQIELNCAVEMEKTRRVELLDILTNYGFTKSFAREHLDACLELGEEPSVDDLLDSINTAIPCVEGDLIAEGGVIAFMGPTGVGKTTTLSKIASLYSRAYGNEKVALITVDTYRMGAVSQLEQLATALDVDFYVCETPAELKDTLSGLGDKDLILLDTAGKSQKDKALHNQLKHFLNGKIKNLLVLHAGNQFDVLDSTIESFSELGIDGVILSKIDECMSLGAPISAVCKHRMPVQYLTTGQQVPQDIEKADNETLINKACDLVGHSRS